MRSIQRVIGTVRHQRPDCVRELLARIARVELSRRHLGVPQ